MNDLRKKRRWRRKRRRMRWGKRRMKRVRWVSVRESSESDVDEGEVVEVGALLFTLLTRLLATHCPLCLRAPLRSLVRLFTHSLPPQACGEV